MPPCKEDWDFLVLAENFFFSENISVGLFVYTTLHEKVGSKNLKEIVDLSVYNIKTYKKFKCRAEFHWNKWTYIVVYLETNPYWKRGNNSMSLEYISKRTTVLFPQNVVIL